MSITIEIQRLQTAKEDIKTAIENKGVAVPSGALLSNYDEYIDNISVQSAYILVTSTAGATLTCGSQTYTLGADETEHAFSVGLGTWTVTASKDGDTGSGSVNVVLYDVYRISLTLPGVPNEYQKVEWIKTTGTQYIDTGFIVTAENISFDMKYSVASVYPDYMYMWGFESEASDTNWFVGFRWTCYLQHYIGSSGSLYNTTDTDNEVSMSANNGAWSISHNGVTRTGRYNGTIIGDNGSFLLSATSGYVFNRYPDRLARIKIYYAKLYQNGELVRNMVPCYRKIDNVAGMYDLANSFFYTNAGTGSFVVGGDV